MAHLADQLLSNHDAVLYWAYHGCFVANSRLVYYPLSRLFVWDLKIKQTLRIKTTEICHNQFMNFHEWSFVLESINRYEQEAKYANILTYIKAFGRERKFA